MRLCRVCKRRGRLWVVERNRDLGVPCFLAASAAAVVHLAWLMLMHPDSCAAEHWDLSWR